MHPENNIDNKDASPDNGATLALKHTNTSITTATTSAPPNSIVTTTASPPATNTPPTTTANNNNYITTKHTTPTSTTSSTTSNNAPTLSTTTACTTSPATITTNSTPTNNSTSKKTTTKKAATKNTTTTDTSAKPKAPVSQPRKRKSRSASNESSNASPSPKKRVRKKKSDQPAPTQNGQSSTNCSTPNMTVNPMLSSAPSITVGPSPLIITAPLSNSRLGQYQLDSFQDAGGRYFTPALSSYNNLEHQGAASSLSRSSLSRLFTTSSLDNNANHITNPADDPTKAFEELRDEVWSSLSRNILDQAQKFDIPSMFGLLYTMRTENEKLVNKVRDLKMKLDQMIAVNARLDLPGPMLTQHLNQTSPNFSSVVSSLTSSPRGLTSPSPGSVIGKPMTPATNYNHLNSSLLVHPGYLDRNSPLINQANNGLSNLKPSAVSAPSPPRGSLLVHGNSNRPGLINAGSSPYTPSAYMPK